LADVDMDVAHIGIGHGAAGFVIGDQPPHYVAFAAASLEIDRLAACVLRDATRAGDASAGAARGDDLHGAKLTLDAIEQLPCGRLQAREQTDRLAVAFQRAPGELRDRRDQQRKLRLRNGREPQRADRRLRNRWDQRGQLRLGRSGLCGASSGLGHWRYEGRQLRIGLHDLQSLCRWRPHSVARVFRSIRRGFGCLSER
jgi:hypothetical protein